MSNAATSAPVRPSHLRKKTINPTAATPMSAEGRRAVKSLSPSSQ